MDKTLIITTLGLAADATDAQVVAKLTGLVNQQNTIDQLQAKLAAMEKAESEGKVKTLLDDAEAAGKITKTQRPNFEKLAKADFDGTKAAIDSMQAYTPPTKVIENTEQKDTANLSDAAKFDKLDKEGKLAELSATNREEYDRLLEAKMAQLKKTGIVK